MEKIKTNIIFDAFQAIQLISPLIPYPNIIQIDKGFQIKKDDDLPATKIGLTNFDSDCNSRHRSNYLSHYESSNQ